MSNTDSAYFIPLYKYIVQNNIYIPKLNVGDKIKKYIDILHLCTFKTPTF